MSADDPAKVIAATLAKQRPFEQGPFTRADQILDALYDAGFEVAPK